MTRIEIENHITKVKAFIDEKSQYYMSSENMTSYADALRLYLQLQKECRRLILQEINEEYNDL
jgi:hypothetical protein